MQNKFVPINILTDEPSKIYSAYDRDINVMLCIDLPKGYDKPQLNNLLNWLDELNNLERGKDRLIVNVLSDGFNPRDVPTILKHAAYTHEMSHHPGLDDRPSCDSPEKRRDELDRRLQAIHHQPEPNTMPPGKNYLKNIIECQKEKDHNESKNRGRGR